MLRQILVTAVMLTTSVSLADTPALDGMGRAMLDPLRVENLRPDETIKRVGIARDAVIADVGAGAGFWTLPLARAASRGRVTALDVRRDYLDVVAARAREARLMNVETRPVGAASCDLARSSTDIVWMSQVNQYAALCSPAVPCSSGYALPPARRIFKSSRRS